ncbi:hypothetical protein JQ628_22820 [Bradyrhizobium lablabi]|uniref:hypothetical protein n=1 Tax=Bradyrhizobium lablabi TaxID=722472 RepID=UPI001BA8DF05|nr:hypothetical protein [Bradyrhizobium lablabi]MBR1124379.1 hypothetical protein [Bradyrhizobium lablabi]
MQRLILGLVFYLALASTVDAKCVGSRYSVRLGTDLNIQRTTDGTPCTHSIGSSRDPIYGIDVKSRPKHGSLVIIRRLAIVYRPTPGFKGQDSYIFQWVGKLGGTTPSAMTMNVSVTVK